MPEISEQKIINVVLKVCTKYICEIVDRVPYLPGGRGEIICEKTDKDVLVGISFSLKSGSESAYAWTGTHRGKPTNSKEEKLDFYNLEESLDEYFRKNVN